MDVVYTDLKAAFDRVNHSLLLAKLERLGFSASMVEWFRSYLTARSYCVQVDCFFSTVFESSSGVPQGSNLGPLLFSLFFNDITSAVSNSEYLLYADDLKLFLPIREASDVISLQSSVNCFSDWCEKNDLVISVVSVCVSRSIELSVP